MAISVRFPDGSQRDVPSELRPVAPVTTGAQSRFRHVPINCDPDWRYVQIASIWHARPRRACLAILPQPHDTWWQGIGAMGDGTVRPRRKTNPSRAA